MQNGFSSRMKIAKMWASTLKRSHDPVQFLLFGWWLRDSAKNLAEFAKSFANEAAFPERLWPLVRVVRRLKHSGPGNPDPDICGHSPPPFRRALGIGSAALVLLMMSLVGGYLYLGSGGQTYATAVGGYLRAGLHDGSVLELNTDTAVDVQLGLSERRIEMHRGEATFTVAHEKRPFSVIAGPLQVRAVGTAFNVRVHAPGHVSVIVTEGKVDVSQLATGGGVASRFGRRDDAAAIGTYRVSAGETAEFRLGQIVSGHIDAAGAAQRLAWHEGRLRFDGTTLAQVAEEFNRYNTIKLIVADPAIAGLRIGGQFSTTGVETFLAAWQRKTYGGLAERKHDPGSGAEIVLLYRPAKQ